MPDENTVKPAKRMFYVSPLIFIAFNFLTPVLTHMREFPMDVTTWREGSVFRTNWAKDWHHFTSPGGWGVINQGRKRKFISQGSVLSHDGTCVVLRRIEQRPQRDFGNSTFTDLTTWTNVDARGEQFMYLEEVEVKNGDIVGLTGVSWEEKLTDEVRWRYEGQIEAFNPPEGIAFPTTASGFRDGCTKDDPLIAISMNMDACTPLGFSTSMDGMCYLYGRDLTNRASYAHFVWPLAAVPKGVDKNLATALLSRDVAFTEQHELRAHRVTSGGKLQWQKVFAHLANFVSDREGSDNPLGRIHSAKGTKNEWKCFTGQGERFDLGARGEDSHVFGSTSRMFNTVCLRLSQNVSMFNTVCGAVLQLCSRKISGNCGATSCTCDYAARTLGVWRLTAARLVGARRGLGAHHVQPVSHSPVQHWWRSLAKTPTSPD